MNTISKFAAIAVLALFASFQLAAQSCYSEPVTSQTSVTVNQSTHQKSPGFSLRVLDSNGNVRLRNTYSVTKNSSDDFTFSFGASFTGSVYVCGGYSVPSNHSWDAEPVASISANQGVLSICGSCASGNGNFAARSYNGHSFIMSSQHQFQRALSSDGSITVRAWIANGVLYFGVSDSGGGYTNPSHSAVSIQNNVSAFPSSVIELFEGTLQSSGGVHSWTSTTDKRPF